jgi:prephenate dehydrogenase
MRVAFLGFGLIGGSIARALHERTPGTWEIAAWSPSGLGPQQAVDAGEIAEAASNPQAAVDGADLIVLAAPPLDCLDFLDAIAGPLRDRLVPGAIVTDVASTKGRLVARAAELRVQFVGGHPMAGVERSGFDAADPGLFVGRPWVVCTDGAAETSIRRIEELATDVGARPLRMDAATHDAAVAAISHLPLVLSAALVDSVFGRGADSLASGDVRAAARELAASGWRDMTRLARGDVAMGAGIAATNADQLALRIRALQVVLDAWLRELEQPGAPVAEDLAARLTEARGLLVDGARGAGE